MALSIFKKIFRFQSEALKIWTTQQSTYSREAKFLGVKTIYTNELKYINGEDYDTIPIYGILRNNEIPEPSIFNLNDDTLIKMYQVMSTLSVMDKVLYESQRQGRISFYMQNTGEEAIQIGSAAALTLQDMIYAQYREAGVLLWRGYPIIKFLNQCYGNCEDEGKGRQMPVHYGCKDLNFVTISSPLTTQLPQAVGAAYAFKRENKQSCVVCYFGEGAASEGDAHAAFNFAATLDCPVIFICRNNGYAISTAVNEQFRGDGIAARGPAYGIRTIRVDGNDVIAVYNATKAARNYCIEKKKPLLIEAMTYRIGSHSTSDDSTAYRSPEEVDIWNKTHHPITIFRNYLESIGLWNNEEETKLTKTAKKDVLQALQEGGKKLKPEWKELFTDVYQEMPQHLKKQMATMEEHIKTYHQNYQMDSFK